MKDTAQQVDDLIANSNHISKWVEEQSSEEQSRCAIPPISFSCKYPKETLSVVGPNRYSQDSSKVLLSQEVLQATHA